MKKGTLTKLPYKNITKQYFYLWLISIAVFYLSIASVGGNFLNGNGFNLLFCLVGAMVGVISFLLLLFSIFKNKDWRMLAISGGVFILFFVILYSIPSADLSTGNSKIDQNDPLVDCPIHVRCGGGLKRMRQSACVNSSCCQIGNVAITLDKDECKLKQQEYTQNIKPAPKIQFPDLKLQTPAATPRATPTELPLCCKEKWSSLTGTYTTTCVRSRFCF